MILAGYDFLLLGERLDSEAWSYFVEKMDIGLQLDIK